MLVIFILSSVPDANTDPVSKLLADLNPTLQNILHVPLFGMLVLLWFLALQNFALDHSENLRLTLGISLCYALVDECHQYFVPGRVVSVLDILLNLVGIGIAGYWISQRHTTAVD